ncbi:MAG: host-nuclease inhibitor Gam family protein [Bacillota bacterium]|nr:host-nuclease inhibitor Gam family protein [Bacillota bacterium]
MSTAEERLEAALAEAWDAPVESVRAREGERFQIDSEEKLDWALRKIARIRAEEAQVAEAAERRIAPIVAWRDAEVARLRRDEEFFLALVADYHLRLLAEDPRRKTIRRPFGVVKARAQQPEVERDDRALLAWLKERGLGAFVEVVERPSWGELKKRLVPTGPTDLGEVRFVDPETGEVVPGVVGRVRGPKVTVEIPGEGGDGDGNE